ncbi:MAG: nickel-dependent lactate racemase, partial [Selenomonadales bacterium]|nr:nickel-dependent lactate racemase [Selenomonadales bacterium]
MKQFELGFGKGSMTIALPEKNILAEVEGNEYPAIENIEAEVKNVLRNPIGSAPLKDLVKAGEKVGIVVSDVTRGWIRYDRFLHFILDELNEAGVPDSDITLIVGLGSHRLHTEEEHKSVYGISADRVAISQTMSNVEDAFEYLGTTSHGTEAKVNKIALAQDKLILTGGIVYHLLAGFGGGRKSIVPAITAYDTIQQNHRLTLTKEVGGGANPACGSGLTEGNPMNEDLIEIAKMVNPDFIFNITLTAEGQFAGFFAGDWMQAW